MTSRFFRSFVSFFENVGRAKAAHQLYIMGLHEEAKSLMLDRDKKESE